MYTVTVVLAFLCAACYDRSEAAVAVLSTKFKQNGTFYCPKYSFVSSFVIKKGERENGKVKDFSFYMECDMFTPPDFDDKGPERCVVRFKWAMGGYQLKMDDHFKSCSCDEYLAGIKTNWTDGERIVQYRCCYSKNKIHNITGCYFTGQRPLMAPWNTEIRTKKGRKVTEGIQTFAIIDDMVIGRVCPYFVKDIDIDSIDYMTNKCWGVKQRSIKDIMDKLKSMAEECKIYMSSPFGWTESQNSLSSDKNFANRDDRIYEKQKTMCKDGSYLYAIYKFPKVGDKGKDYVFLTRCHVLVYTVCYCGWKQNCTKPEKRNTSESNKTMYVAGWRSEWDEDNARRKFELWCCKSDGLTMHFCNLTKNYTDADTSIVIARPRYKFFAFYQPKCIDGQIIRDVDHWYIKGVLQLRFNICNINGSDGDCEKPCKGCKDIDPTEAICRPPVVVVPIIIQSTSTSTKGPTTVGGVVTVGTTHVVTTHAVTTPTTTTIATTTSTQTTTTTTPRECIVDINFLLDSSDSLTQSGFDQEILFIKTFVSKLNIAPTKSRVALVEFGNTAVQQWDFSDINQDQATIQDYLGQLPWFSSNTNITGALFESKPAFKTQSRHTSATTCIPRAAVLVTDGRNNLGIVHPSVPAAELRAMGISVFAVGIGPLADKVELDTITGDPSKVFMVEFATLQAIVDNVKNAVCAQQDQHCPPNER